MNMRKIICISGDLASGKSEVGRMLASSLNYEYFSAGTMFRLMAEEKGMDVLELTSLAKTDPSIDEMIDKRITEIGETREKVIFDSRLAWHFVKGGFNVYLTIDINESARRVLADSARGSVEKYKSFEEALEALKWRSDAEAKRYMERYCVDIHDLNNYNIVIDTTEKTRDQVCSLIINSFYDFISSNI